MIPDSLESGSPDPLQPVAETVLSSAAHAVNGPRATSYGDARFGFAAIADLKTAFWRHFTLACDRLDESYPETGAGPFVDARSRNTAFGHAIDMILTNLGRIATSPQETLDLDRFIDGAGYFALAREIESRPVL